MKQYTLLASLVLANYGYAQPVEYTYQSYENNYNPYLYETPNIPNNNYYYDYDYGYSYDYDQSHPNSQSNPAQKTANQPNQKVNSDASKDNANTDKDKKAEPNKKEEPKKEEDKKEEEKPKSPHTFTGNVSIVSDYRFRGISQTMRRPAIQGGFDYSHVSGLYLGTWASNVDGTTNYFNNTSMEWDLYGGYKGKLFPCAFPDFAYNFGLIYYYYPGGKEKNPQNTRYNTAEVFLELTYKWLAVKYSESVTNYFGVDSSAPPFNWNTGRADSRNGNSQGSNYIEASLTFDLIEKVKIGCYEAGKLNLLLHAGHVTVRHYEHLSYTDWRATLTQEFDWFNVFLTYVGTNAKHAYYDVPDSAHHPKRHGLGVQGVVFGVIKTL